MLRIGIRDYMVGINTLNDFIELYEEDDSRITDTETARSYIGQVVSCFKFTESGFMYKKFLAILTDIKPVYDPNFKRDSWEIEIKIDKSFPVITYEDEFKKLKGDITLGQRN